MRDLSSLFYSKFVSFGFFEFYLFGCDILTRASTCFIIWLIWCCFGCFLSLFMIIIVTIIFLFGVGMLNQGFINCILEVVFLFSSKKIENCLVISDNVSVLIRWSAHTNDIILINNNFGAFDNMENLQSMSFPYFVN